MGISKQMEELANLNALLMFHGFGSGVAKESYMTNWTIKDLKAFSECELADLNHWTHETKITSVGKLRAIADTVKSRIAKVQLSRVDKIEYKQFGEHMLKIREK